MDGVGKLAGWRWIFILEGIATVLIGFIAWLMMPADLNSAKFFTDEERQFARKSIAPLRFPHLTDEAALQCGASAAHRRSPRARHCRSPRRR